MSLLRLNGAPAAQLASPVRALCCASFTSDLVTTMTPVKLCHCNYGVVASSRMFSTFLREYQGLLRHRYRALASFPASQFSSASQLPRKKKLLPAPKAVGTSLQDLFKQDLPSVNPFTIDPSATVVPYLEDSSRKVDGGKLYVETYGCQMNVNDMEIVLAIMKDSGYTEIVQTPEESDIIFINTCAIRENAEHKIWHRLNYFKHLKTRWNRDPVLSATRPAKPPKVAVLGCMAERLKEKLIVADKMVDVVCGPDAYRDLPRLLSLVDEGQTGINTLLSLEETYADVSPVRIAKNSVTAFVSIMRGCNNMCSFCIVPFTRGRERSRPVTSIVREVGELWEQGVKEVVLLGQNVNSYNDTSETDAEDGTTLGTEESPVPAIMEASVGDKKAKYMSTLSPGFSTVYKTKELGLSFTHLLDVLSAKYPEMRFRFTSPHPKDFPDDLLFLMRDRANVCNMIHLPAQSGSTRVLERMRRGYSREAYLACVERIRLILPDVSISSDFISGFCGESEEDHQDTLKLVEAVGYDMAYMFAYSMREKTHAHRNYEDDVPEPVKQRRLAEMITKFRETTLPRFTSQLQTMQLVLVEGPNKRAPETELVGKSDKGHRVIFPKVPVMDGLSAAVNSEEGCNPFDRKACEEMYDLQPGDFVEVYITETTHASLRGEPLLRTSIAQFHEKYS